MIKYFPFVSKSQKLYHFSSGQLFPLALSLYAAGCEAEKGKLFAQKL